MLSTPALALALVLYGAGARAQGPDPPTVEVPRPPPVGDVRLGVGYRHGLISDPTFDTFARDDRLSQLSLDVTYAPVNTRQGAVAVGVAWDFGSRSAITNELPARIDVHRFTVPLEGRLYLSSWAYVFGRVAAGTATYQYRITDPAVPLSGSPWVYAADFSAGASVLLWPHGELEQRVARAWLTPEIGYGWTSATDIALDSRRGPIVVATAPERLPELALRGAFFRVQLGLTL
jgi:hypothetical protein